MTYGVVKGIVTDNNTSVAILSNFYQTNFVEMCDAGELRLSVVIPWEIRAGEKWLAGRKRKSTVNNKEWLGLWVTISGVLSKGEDVGWIRKRKS